MQILTKKIYAEETKICPICKSACGYHQHGYYYRQQKDIKGKKSIETVCRRRCRAGNKNGPTFSYLPSQLIPYHQYSLELIFRIISSYIDSLEPKKNDRLNETIDKYSEAQSNWMIKLHLSHIQYFHRIFEIARQRLSTMTKQIIGTMKDFMSYCEQFQYQKHQGITALNQYFFETQGRYLFGTASQHRRYWD